MVRAWRRWRIGDPPGKPRRRAVANPYLFTASQIVSGLDRIERKLDPGPQDLDPYNARRTMLPKTLGEALDALEKDALFRTRLGAVFIDYYVKLKRNEAGRYARFLQDNGIEDRPNFSDGEPTAWEQNEYFDFF